VRVGAAGIEALVVAEARVAASPAVGWRAGELAAVVAFARRRSKAGSERRVGKGQAAAVRAANRTSS